MFHLLTAARGLRNPQLAVSIHEFHFPQFNLRILKSLFFMSDDQTQGFSNPHCTSSSHFDTGISKSSFSMSGF